MRSSTLASALSHRRNRLVSSASSRAISTTPRPVRSLILPLLKPAPEVPRVRTGCNQDGDVRHEQDPGAAAESAPIAATTLHQAVNLAVGGHDGHHRSAGEGVRRRHWPDGDAGEGSAKTMDVALAGLDDRISV